MSDIIREALLEARRIDPRADGRAWEAEPWDAALAELDRRDLQDAADQEHLTRVVEKHVAERAALEAERDEANETAEELGDELRASNELRRGLEERVRQLDEGLLDARELLARFEYLPYGAHDARRWVDGAWVTDKEIAAELGQPSRATCTICTWPEEGHGGPGRYKGNAENTHEQGCSMYAVLHGEPAHRLRHSRARAGGSEDRVA